MRAFVPPLVCGALWATGALTLLPAAAKPEPARPAAVTQAARPPVLTPVVVARYPHATDAFTEGLQYLGNGTYIESTGEVEGSGASGVRRVDLRTGRVQREVPTPLTGAFGEGVTVLNGAAYHLTWKDGVAFALDAATLRETGRYRYQGEGWGITTDGKSLIMGSGSPELVWRDPRTFAVQKRLTVTDQGQPVRNLNELEYVQGSLYANIWLTDRIARIDPATGKVTAWIDVSALTREVSHRRSGMTFDDVANGIAFVPERGTLLLTGKRWPTLFEVRLPGLKAESGTTGATRPRS
ncbi:glutaminyl-peptide cyclotransferase [Deinococcus petrolearius]|uniref:Glutaminyl-peptide cyclotransferase n=1 Tax=Deinococcus petrolearius TaxID=1751295 RepID=A0ABW1DN41_9DEIO